MMLGQAKTMTKWIGASGFCAVALAATGCAGGNGGSAVSLTSPSVAAVSTSRVTATAAVDGPLIALKKAVANCGNHGDVLNVLQVVFGGVGGHAPVIHFISDTSGVFMFSLGTTVFTIFYDDNDLDNHLSCGDTVTGATP